MSATQLIEYCHKLAVKDLPSHVSERAKVLILDFIGVATRGSTRKLSEVLRKMGMPDDGNGGHGAAIIGSKVKALAEYAALANGAAAHVTEMDDMHKPSSTHPGSVVIATVLACAESDGEPVGPDCLDAVVTGYEVMARVGRALKPSSHYARGFHPTATCGVFGAAGASARMFNLGTDAMLNAVGIAGSFASGSMEFMAESRETWVKPLQVGWAAHSGIVAARLAREGFKAPAMPLEGPYGFLHAYSDEGDPELLIDGLGSGLAVSETGVKLYSCCGYEHTPIEATLAIVRRTGLVPEDVREISVEIVSPARPIIAEPWDVKLSPSTILEAQTSLPFGIALAIAHQGGTLEHYDDYNLNSDIMRRLMMTIRYETSAEMDKALPNRWPARVTIVTNSGQSFTEYVEEAQGDPGNFPGVGVIIDKFKLLTQGVYSRERQEAIIDVVMAIDEEKSIRELFALLTSDLELVAR